MNRRLNRSSPEPPINRQHRRLPSGAIWKVCLLLGVSVVLCGCGGDEDLDRVYGRRRGMNGGKSVNGTAVLSSLLEHAGRKIVTKSALSPAVHEADAIVWFPDDFDPPSQEAVDWLDDWMQQHDGGVVVYVGRDFDASLPYWDKVIPNSTGPEAAEMRRRRNEALMDFTQARREVTGPVENEWFSYDPGTKQRDVTTLSGPWSEGIDATAVEIKLRGRQVPIDVGESEILLQSEDDILVSRHVQPLSDDYRYDEYGYQAEWEPSQLILVENGSFLLNAALVNHEHRKLAGKLIDELEGQKTIVFLQSDRQGVRVLERDPPKQTPSGLRVFTVWPLNIIMVHLTIIGLVLCFARWPIFGRPGHLERPSNSDFGAHVEALGKLLQRTGDRNYVTNRVFDYQQSQHGESSGHDEPASKKSS